MPNVERMPSGIALDGFFLAFGAGCVHLRAEGDRCSEIMGYDGILPLMVP